MGAMFIGQQFLQNVLQYSTVEAGAAILPAIVMMVIVAPRSAKLIEAHGARLTLLTGYVFCLLGFLTMLVLWDDGISYWPVGLGYAFIGAGVGFAGTPASHSLTGSVPVKRAGMASGTADLQRDLGGAILQSIFGALLTAGYAAAFAAAITASPDASQVSDDVQAELTKSFASAEATAEQYPQYASQITAAAETSFLDGADWAYTAGIIAILVGATLVFVMFPKHDDEVRLLAEYHATGHCVRLSRAPRRGKRQRRGAARGSSEAQRSPCEPSARRARRIRHETWGASAVDDATGFIRKSGSCFRISRRAMVILWTSSGPSAMRRVRMWAYISASGKYCVTPAAPWTWMARSITLSAMFGMATLMPEISVAADLLPTVSMRWAVRSTYSRAMSISMRDSAIQSWMSPFWATRVPKVDRCSERSTMYSRARSATPIARMQWWMRPGPRRAWEMAKPPPSSPSRLSAGTRTFS